MNQGTRLFALAAALAAVSGCSKGSREAGSIAGKVSAAGVRYLDDTVVYLEAVPGTYPARTVSMDQRGMKFIPRLLLVTAGDTVRFLNHDNEVHNVYSPDGEQYDLGFFKENQEATYTFAKPGVYAQRCRIHPQMLAYVFVGQNPHAAAADGKGYYLLEGVPPGSYQLSVWNAGQLRAPKQPVVVEAGKRLAADLALQR
jgi:plastocyanin